MNAVEKRDLLDTLNEINDLHQDGHVEDEETHEIHIVPSLALTLAGMGHEAVLHEGAQSFCPGCRVIELVRTVRKAVEAMPVAALPRRGAKG